MVHKGTVYLENNLLQARDVKPVVLCTMCQPTTHVPLPLIVGVIYTTSLCLRGGCQGGGKLPALAWSEANKALLCCNMLFVSFVGFFFSWTCWINCFSPASLASCIIMVVNPPGLVSLDPLFRGEDSKPDPSKYRPTSLLSVKWWNPLSTKKTTEMSPSPWPYLK